MTENTNQNTENTQDIQEIVSDLPQMSELDMLKSRARMMGIGFSNNIGVDALKAKIQAKMDGQTDRTDEDGNVNESEMEINALEALGAMGVQKGDPDVQETQTEKPLTLRQMIEKDAMKLIRCRITNMDPKKKDLQGEIFTVANEYIGTVRRFVPFGEITDDGWHIPQCIFDMMKARKFLNIRTARDRRTGTMKVSQSWSPEFAIEILEPLTKAQLQQLAQAQIAAGSIDNNNGSVNAA